MELPLLVDFLYVDRGRVSNTLAAGTPENVPSLAHRGVFNCQPSVTVANYLWEPCLHCITGLSRHHCTVKRWRITICHSSQVLPSERPRLWKEPFSNRGDGLPGWDRWRGCGAGFNCYHGYCDWQPQRKMKNDDMTPVEPDVCKWWLQKTKKGGCFHGETSIQAWILYIHSPVHTLTHIWLLQVSQQCLANHDQIIPELLHQNHQKPRLHKDTKQPSLAKKYQNPSNNKWCILTTVWHKTSARYTDRDTNNHKWCLPASWLFCVFREFLHVCADPGNLVLTDPRCALETMRQYNSHP